ncbi:MAG: CCA tRNA nucleotidyltransferase, partial [Erythrobacter sp.]
LLGADARALSDYTPPVFPMKGGEIVARGIAAGPQVARILQEIEGRWIAEGFPDRARVEEMLSDAVSKG